MRALRKAILRIYPSQAIKFYFFTAGIDNIKVIFNLKLSHIRPLYASWAYFYPVSG